MIEGRWRQAKNILCVRLDYLGDVLMTTPALRALKQSLPGCRLTLLSSPGGAAAARFIPDLDDAIAYAAPWMKNSGEPDAEADHAMIHLLRQRRFDAAAIFTVYSQSPLPAALLCHLAGIPLRLAHCRENPYQLLTHWARETEPQEGIRHEAQRQLDLVAAIGAQAAERRLAFQIPPADTAWIKNRLQQIGVGNAWLLLHPGATAASRRYPVRHWIAAARELSARLDCALIFTGSRQEAALVEEIRAPLPRSHSLAGQLDLGKLAALISLSRLLISNNTAPVHIAAAVGTPVVDLYALTNPQHTPWQVPNRVLFHDVPCRFCYKSVCPQGHHRCLEQLAPDAVVEAALDLWQSGKTAPM